MKKIAIFVSCCSVLLTLLCLSSASAYTIEVNGYVNDWGINLGLATSAGYLDTNLPSGPNVVVVHEDNADASTNNYIPVDPGYSIGNRYDAEAMYFDRDINNIYLAIISGVKLNDSSYPAGDIAIDADGDNKYEYGINVNDGWLYQVDPLNDWSDTIWFKDKSNPWRMKNLTTDKRVAKVPFVYSDIQNSHYVIETSIPSDKLGYPVSYNFHWTMKCGNDVLDLSTGFPPPPVPEPASLTLLGLGLAGLAGFTRRRR